MKSPDTLGLVEKALLAEEVTSQLRHDLRNHLAVIRGAVHYLRRKVRGTPLWSEDARVQDFFAAIEEQVDGVTLKSEGAKLAERLFARRAAPTELHACARLAIESARTNPHVRVVPEVPAARILADPREIALALRCLVDNAIEAIPEGGVVVVREGTACSPGFIAVEVTGSGEGFRDVTVEEAMRPYFTTKEGHAGLGLNIAHRICKRYGGKLRVNPAAEGSSVELLLPLCPADGGVS